MRTHFHGAVFAIGLTLLAAWAAKKPEPTSLPLNGCETCLQTFPYWYCLLVYGASC